MKAHFSKTLRKNFSRKLMKLMLKTVAIWSKFSTKLTCRELHSFRQLQKDFFTISVNSFTKLVERISPFLFWDIQCRILMSQFCLVKYNNLLLIDLHYCMSALL